MGVEELEAALTISLALNKKNAASMKVSQTEIMRTLVRQCKPSLDDREGKVLFEPVRAKMTEYYWASVDHPDFHHAF